ncbi:MAG: hypothetical protein JXB49_19015 [Bacteroidales bacterium]|nr:hypothetical protein [Bacteroidales bacterium]
MGSNNYNLSEEEAVFCLLVAMLNTDGKFSDKEMEDFGYVFTQIRMFSGQSFNDFFPKYEKIHNDLGNDVLKIAEAVIPDISEDNYLGTFSNCVELMVTDGYLSTEDKKVFDYLKGAFSIEDDMAQDVLKLMENRARL